MTGGIFIAKFLVWFIRFLPHRIALCFGRFLGRILRLVLWKKVDRCEARCVKALGVGITEARKIIRGSFINMGMSAVEFIRLPEMKSNVKNFMTFDEKSINFLKEALNRGKGVLLMVSHMDNWELAAMRVHAEGFPRINAVYTPQRNQGGINDIIMDIRLNNIGMTMTGSEGAELRKIFRTLKNNGIVAIMQDLDARKDGVITKFFGLPASTHDGIIKLHEKFGSAIIPVHCVRDKNNPAHHNIIFTEILSDRKNFDLQICNEVIEGWIKENPSQWFWILDRWEYTLGKKI